MHIINKKRAFGLRALIKKIKEIIDDQIWVINEYSKDHGGNKYRGFYEVLKFRLNTLLIHKPTLLWYSIRNYSRWEHFHQEDMFVKWELAKPLTLTYAFVSRENFCPSCEKLKDTDEHFEFCDEDINHAHFVKFYERPIWSFNYKYVFTKCHCENLLFEPLETYYNTGGEEGSGSFTRPDAQWTINEELGYDPDPMERHKKQLVPRNYRGGGGIGLKKGGANE